MKNQGNDPSETASRKIGIKLLDRPQIQSLLPDFEEMLKSIDRQRKRAEQQHFQADERMHLLHDNIIGIFGGRGSGKTSVLYSLREYLKKQNVNDIILPVISPELISESCSMLSWIITMFGEIVKSLEFGLAEHPKLLQTLSERYDRQKCPSVYSSSFLSREYEALLRECGGTRGLQEMRKYEYEDLIRLQSEYSREQYNLMGRLSRFWEILVYTQHLLNNSQMPLIFIMLDDIDLAPERSMELLLSAYKYFSSPYVVIVLTAAMNTIRQVLTCRMYEKVVGSNFSSLIQGNDILGFHVESQIDSYHIDRASESAAEYLNKVIPQTSRYELNRYSTYDRKLLFRYSIEQNERDYDLDSECSIPLGELILDLVRKRGLWPDCGRFLESENDSKQLAKEYYLMFGDKSRYINNSCLGIINACDQLHELKLRGETEQPEKLGERYVHEVYYALCHLLNVLITSHTRFLQDCCSWIPEMLKFTYGRHYLFINYSYLLEQYRKCSAEVEEFVAREMGQCKNAMAEETYWERYSDRLWEHRLQIKQKIITLFVMLNFIEKLTTVLAPCYYRALKRPQDTHVMHGRSDLLALINQDAALNENLTLFPEVKDIDSAMNLYVDILFEPGRFLHFNIRNSAHVEDYFDYLAKHPALGQMLSSEMLHESCAENPDWMRTVCTMLYLTQSGIQLLKPNFFSEPIAFFDDLSLLGGMEWTISYYQKEMILFLDAWNFQEEAEAHQNMFMKWSCSSAVASDSFDAEKAWNDWCKDLENLIKESNSRQRILQSFAAQLREDGLQDTRDFAPHLCEKVKKLLLQCSTLLMRLPLIVSIQPGDVANMTMSISAIADAVPSLESRGRQIIQAVNDSLSSNEGASAMLPFSHIMTFLQIANHHLRVMERNESRQEDEFTFGAYYRSHLMDLCSAMHFYSQPEDTSQTLAFFRKVYLLLALLPYYFNAQFILINRQEYAEFRIKGNSADGKSGETTDAAQAYARLRKAIEEDGQINSSHAVLYEMMTEIKYVYSRRRMREFGITDSGVSL